METPKEQKNLGKLSKSLKDIEDSWTTLYTHIKNAYNKAGEAKKNLVIKEK